MVDLADLTKMVAEKHVDLSWFWQPANFSIGVLGLGAAYFGVWAWFKYERMQLIAEAAERTRNAVISKFLSS